MSILRYGIIDIINSFRKYDLIRMLGRQYMVLRYRRSKLGPFWITISMGIQILTLGLIFGQLFDASIHKFFPFLAIGIILWNYITAIISEGSTSFISSTGMITQLEFFLSRMDFVSFFTAQRCNHSFCLYCDVVFLKLEGRSGCSRFPVVNSQCILDGYGFCNFLHSISRFPPIDYKCPANIFLCDSNYVDARTYAPKSRTAPS